jgi:hypothetical protein
VWPQTLQRSGGAGRLIGQAAQQSAYENHHLKQAPAGAYLARYFARAVFAIVAELSATGFRRKCNCDRLGKSDRDSVADLNALQRGRIRHVNVFRRTIGSLQSDALIGLVDRRDYDDELPLHHLHHCFSPIRWIPFQKVDVKPRTSWKNSAAPREPKHVRGYIGLSIFGETQIWTRVY